MYPTRANNFYNFLNIIPWIDRKFNINNFFENKCLSKTKKPVGARNLGRLIACTLYRGRDDLFNDFSSGFKQAWEHEFNKDKKSDKDDSNLKIKNRLLTLSNNQPNQLSFDPQKAQYSRT